MDILSRAEELLVGNASSGASPSKPKAILDLKDYNLFSACPQYAAARDHRAHLFLIVPNVIVLRPLCARGQLELIIRKPATPS